MSPRDDFRLKSRVFDWQNTSLYNDVIFVHEARLAPEVVASGLVYLHNAIWLQILSSHSLRGTHYQVYWRAACILYEENVKSTCRFRVYCMKKMLIEFSFLQSQDEAFLQWSPTKFSLKLSLLRNKINLNDWKRPDSTENPMNREIKHNLEPSWHSFEQTAAEHFPTETDSRMTERFSVTEASESSSEI